MSESLTIRFTSFGTWLHLVAGSLSLVACLAFAREFYPGYVPGLLLLALGVRLIRNPVYLEIHQTEAVARAGVFFSPRRVEIAGWNDLWLSGRRLCRARDRKEIADIGNRFGIRRDDAAALRSALQEWQKENPR
ncbi:MAG: hypothetical protein NTX33_16650 [Propionibacteriales bacterium]|nr:hypothetical protein [Propionibacteriales bacterium]